MLGRDFFEKTAISVRYDYIIEYLCSTAGPAFDGQGSADNRVNKLVEAGIAEAFRRYMVDIEGDEGNDFFRVIDDKTLCIFNGKYFERTIDVKLEGILREVMRRMQVGLVYLVSSVKVISRYLIDSMLADESKRFKPDRNYVCFKNGVLDIRTMEFNEHNPKYCTDIIMSYDYNPQTRSGLWDSVIEKTIPDEGMRTAFQQFCGAFLLDRHKYKFEYICFCVGEGQNGKSVICRAMVNLFRNEDAQGQAITKCITTYTPEQLFKSNQMDYHMAEVQGKIMNYCDDVSDKDFSGGDFKAFVSGGEFIGRSPYGREVVVVTDVPLMLCCANKIPPTTDDSDGYFRRFLIINCPNKVSEKDKDTQLEAKLKADDVRCAIFNWILEGYRQLIANGCKIEMSDAVRQLKEDMKADSNSCRRWIREMNLTVVTPSGTNDYRWRSFREWIQMYTQYCKDYSEGYPKTSKAVAKIFNEMGFEHERRRDGMWYCIGTDEPIEKGGIEEDTSAFGLAEDMDDDLF